jgi:hypothetical protein
MWIEVDTTPSPHAHTRHLLFSFLFQTPQLHAPSSASYASRCPSWLTSRGLGVMVVHAAAAVRALSHPPPALKLCTKGAPADPLPHAPASPPPPGEAVPWHPGEAATHAHPGVVPPTCAIMGANLANATLRPIRARWSWAKLVFQLHPAHHACESVFSGASSVKLFEKFQFGRAAAKQLCEASLKSLRNRP